MVLTTRGAVFTHGIQGAPPGTAMIPFIRVTAGTVKVKINTGRTTIANNFNTVVTIRRRDLHAYIGRK
jgi:hypothetical protein